MDKPTADPTPDATAEVEPTGEATTAPPPPAPTVEPPSELDADEAVRQDQIAVASLLDLDPDGSIRVKLDPVLVLPRPKFGAMRDLVKENGRVNDALGRLRDHARSYSMRVIDEGREQGANQHSIEAVARRDQIRDEARKLSDEADDQIADSLGAWWTLVFERLLPENKRPAPDDWPSWFMDGRLPNVMINHWRFVPKGPG